MARIAELALNEVTSRINCSEGKPVNCDELSEQDIPRAIFAVSHGREMLEALQGRLGLA
jgi:hypothetical protein